MASVDLIISCVKTGQFAMAKTFEDWPGLVNSGAYYALQIREIK